MTTVTRLLWEPVRLLLCSEEALGEIDAFFELHEFSLHLVERLREARDVWLGGVQPGVQLHSLEHYRPDGDHRNDTGVRRSGFLSAPVCARDREDRLDHVRYVTIRQPRVERQT